MMETDLNTVMQQVAKGDEAAFRHLVHKLKARMFSLALRLMGGRKDLAEDALQEALIKLWVTAPRFRPEGRIEAYLARLVYTACMDIHRKQRPSAVFSDEIPDQTASGAESDMMDADRRTQLFQAIERLPEKQKAALILTYFGGHTNKSVAAIMSASEKAVESLLVRARKSLAQKLPQDMKEEYV